MHSPTAHPLPATPDPVSWRQALRFWLRLGFISFGGPAGQIAIMQRELVDDRRWISQGRFNHALSYCMLLPGPEAQQLATYLGWLMHRTWGGVTAGALFVLPSLFMLIALSWVFVVYGKVPQVAAVLWGVQCAVAAIVVHALVRVARKTLSTPWKNKGSTRILAACSAISFIAIESLNMPFPVIVAAAALVGWWSARRSPAGWTSAAGHGGTGAARQGGALIDDDTPTPAHACFVRSRMIVVLLVGGLLWLLPLLALVMWQGWQASYTQMAWFFTKAALVTFGGAYAVLPYVVQGAVDQYQWLTASQMMAGLALGESTPGPLIMIVAFVGFLGGWSQAALGPEALLLAGMMGASVATWFTFLPSFVFILAGGPFVESTHGKLGFVAPLKAITAAVVGVMASLALLFIRHALWPQGGADGWGGLDMAAALLSLLCVYALFVRNWGVMPLIAVAGGAGLVIKMLLL